MASDPNQMLRDLLAAFTGKKKPYLSRTPGIPTAAMSRRLLKHHNRLLQVMAPDSQYQKLSSPDYTRQLVLPFDKLASAYNRNSAAGVAMRLLKESDPQMKWKPLTKGNRTPLSVVSQNPRYAKISPLITSAPVKIPLMVSSGGGRSSYNPSANHVTLDQTDGKRLLPWTTSDVAGDLISTLGHELRHVKDYYPTNASPIPKGNAALQEAMKGGYIQNSINPFATKMETRAALAQIQILKRIFGSQGVVNNPVLRTHIEMSRNQPNYHVGARKGEKYLNRLLRKLTGESKPNLHKLLREPRDRRMALEEPGATLFSGASPQLGISLADDNP